MTAGATGGPRTVVDDYLAGVDAAIRPTLETLRAQVRDAIGPCDEVMSYAMPGFRLRAGNAHGLKPRVVCGFAAWRHGGSFYPHSGTVLAGFADEAAAYDQTRSALHFTADHPLPADLVRRLVAAKLAELAG